LVSRIIDNLQVSVSNIYFRVEDKLVGKDLDTQAQADPNYCLGFKLKEFHIFTADREYNRVEAVKPKDEKATGKVDPESKLTFKVAQIKGFSIFCDWVNVQDVTNGGIPAALLVKDPSNAGFQDVIQREFGDGKRLEKAIHNDLMRSNTIEMRFQINKDIKNPLMPAT